MIDLVATVRAPRSDLARFVAYHLNTGVDHIHLFFDDPADPHLHEFAGLDRVSATACTPDHWRAAGITPEHGIEVRQRHNATLVRANAETRGAQWIVHLDNDELIYTKDNDLAAWLRRCPSDLDAVTFPVLEAIPHSWRRRHPFEACRLFKAAGVRPNRLHLAARLGCRQALRYGYFRGHMAGKSATRVRSPIDDLGIHFPIGRNGSALKIEAATHAFVLHYDGCTFESWRSKWARRRDGEGLALQMRPDRQRQFADFLAADQVGSRDALDCEFRRQCIIPTHEQAILRLLGLARSIHLDRGLFILPGEKAVRN